MKNLEQAEKMKSNELIVRTLEEKDWKYVSEIYQQGLDTGNASFESDVPTWDKWNDGHLKDCRLIVEINNRIVGFSALSSVSARYVYRGVAEVSVYVSYKFKGQNIGTILLDKLISESEKIGIWTLQAGVFPENKASTIIHERAGFRQVGYRERIGQMKGIWRDTILLERRSNKIEME